MGGDREREGVRREKETVRKAETCLLQRKSLLVQELKHCRRSQKKNVGKFYIGLLLSLYLVRLKQSD